MLIIYSNNYSKIAQENEKLKKQKKELVDLISADIEGEIHSDFDMDEMQHKLEKDIAKIKAK